MSGLFSTGFRTLESALTARERLQITHASNLANADSPFYRADRRTFEDMFEAEQAKRREFGERQISVSDGSIMNRPVNETENFAMRLDGNNVDPQQEMARMAENQLMHELTMRLVKGKIGSLANAIKEGGR